jgi:hypothetical protein
MGIAVIPQILYRIKRLGSVAEKKCVSCEVGPNFYIQEDGIHHSHRRETPILQVL